MGQQWVSNGRSQVKAESGASPSAPHPCRPTTPLSLHSTSGHHSLSPRAPKPVFQASGVCRSDVLTAQVAKATNTRHMSFWLKVKAVRGPRGSPRKENHNLSSSYSTLETWLSGDMSAIDTSVWGHIHLRTRLTWDIFSESHLPYDSSVPRHRAVCGIVESGWLGPVSWFLRDLPEGPKASPARVWGTSAIWACVRGRVSAQPNP